jgi:hypothetical protein
MGRVGLGKQPGAASRVGPLPLWGGPLQSWEAVQ